MCFNLCPAYGGFSLEQDTMDFWAKCEVGKSEIIEMYYIDSSGVVIRSQPYPLNFTDFQDSNYYFHLLQYMLSCLHSFAGYICSLHACGNWHLMMKDLLTLKSVVCVCLVPWSNYSGCTSSILNPLSCLLFPFSSKQKSKSVLLQLFL